jgi:hypothetical protein
LAVVYIVIRLRLQLQPVRLFSITASNTIVDPRKVTRIYNSLPML